MEPSVNKQVKLLFQREQHLNVIIN